MIVYSDILNTYMLPLTVSILHHDLPSIFTSQCFNDADIPFIKEAGQTEIGHLFEHILLEYLCRFKILKGRSRATFQGVTNWNWRKEPRGTFHIAINVGETDRDILEESLAKTVSLTTKIIQEGGAQQYVPAQQIIPVLPLLTLSSPN